jgi:undecaprenyl-diphosphatase
MTALVAFTGSIDDDDGAYVGDDPGAEQETLRVERPFESNQSTGRLTWLTVLLGFVISSEGQDSSRIPLRWGVTLFIATGSHRSARRRGRLDHRRYLVCRPLGAALGTTACSELARDPDRLYRRLCLPARHLKPCSCSPTISVMPGSRPSTRPSLIAASWRSRDATLALAWLACLVAFVVLGVYVARRNGPGIDLDLARAVQDLPGALGHWFDALNWSGGGWPVSVLALGVAGMFLARSQPLEAVLLTLNFAARGTQALMKEAFAAPRPLATQVHVSQTIGSFSYPSGHVVGTTVFFILLLVFAQRLRMGDGLTRFVQAACVAIVLSMPFARVWAGAHWPSDVLGGYLFAALWLIPTLRFYPALRKHFYKGDRL